MASDGARILSGANDYEKNLSAGSVQTGTAWRDIVHHLVRHHRAVVGDIKAIDRNQYHAGSSLDTRLQLSERATIDSGASGYTGHTV